MPGWSILAIEGTVVLTLAVRSLLHARPKAAAKVAVAVATVPIVTLLILAAPLQLQFRTTTGHGNAGIRTVLTELNSAPLSNLPIYVAPSNLVIVPFAYEPELYSRMPLSRDPSNTREVLLPNLSKRKSLQRLENIPTLLLVQFGTLSQASKTAEASVFADYEVTEIRELDEWTVLTLTRKS